MPRTDSVFDAAGTDYIEGTNTLSGSSVFGGAADTLDVTSDSGKYYAGAGVTVLRQHDQWIRYGGSSAGDTAAGNDTLDIIAMTTGYINMGDGANKMEASAIIGLAPLSGAGSDTFTTSCLRWWFRYTYWYWSATTAFTSLAAFLLYYRRQCWRW